MGAGGSRRAGRAAPTFCVEVGGGGGGEGGEKGGDGEVEEVLSVAPSACLVMRRVGGGQVCLLAPAWV